MMLQGAILLVVLVILILALTISTRQRSGGQIDNTNRDKYGRYTRRNPDSTRTKGRMDTRR